MRLGAWSWKLGLERWTSPCSIPPALHCQRFIPSVSSASAASGSIRHLLLTPDSVCGAFSPRSTSAFELPKIIGIDARPTQPPLKVIDRRWLRAVRVTAERPESLVISWNE